MHDSLPWRSHRLPRESTGSRPRFAKDAVDDFENYNINARLLWEPNENLTADFKVRWGEVDAAAITFNAAFAVPSLADPANFGPLAHPAFFEDVNDHEFVFQGNIDPENEQEALEISLKVDYDLGWAELTGWLLYSDVEQSFLADGTSGSFGFFFAEPTCASSTAALFNAGVTLPPPQILGPTPGFSIFGPYTPTACDGYQYQVRNQEDLSFELRLVSPGDERLRWVAGFYYLDIDREVGVATGVDQGLGIDQNLFNPQGGRSPTEQLVHDDFETEVWAVFGELAYDVTDDVELSLALRYDHEKREVSSRVPTNAPTQFIVPINPALLFQSTIPDAEETFDEFQPKVSLTWDLTEEVTLFGSWGIGFKSGGFNNQGSAATVDAFINAGIGTNIQISDIFEEETSSAFEVGARASLLDGRLQLEGAYYHTDVDDMQFFEFFVGPFGLLRVVSNIDEVTIDGVELSARASITDGLTAYAGFNFTDSEIDENDSRPTTEGNESPYTPDYTFNLGVEYLVGIPTDLPGVGGGDLVARLDWQLVGPTWFHTVQSQENPAFFGFFGPANYRRTERDSYDTLDVRIGIEMESWSIYAFGRNVLDEEYLEEVIPAPEFGGSFIHPAAERAYGAEVTYRF